MKKLSLVSSFQDGAQSASAQDLLSQQRGAIDFFSDIRTGIVRCAYAAQVTARPDEASAKDVERRRTRLNVLSEQIAILNRANSIAKGSDPQGEFDRSVCGWISEVSEKHRPLFDQLHLIIPALRKLYEAAADWLANGTPGDPCHDLDEAIKRYIDSTRVFHSHLTDFCSALWHSLDEARQTDMDKSHRTRTAIDDTLIKLEKIGKHVRLVSLNASVEASRAGEAGKGLAVIAIEFKSLAEEIQTLAAVARQDIEQMN